MVGAVVLTKERATKGYYFRLFPLIDKARRAVPSAPPNAHLNLSPLVHRRRPAAPPGSTSCTTTLSTASTGPPFTPSRPTPAARSAFSLPTSRRPPPLPAPSPKRLQRALLAAPLQGGGAGQTRQASLACSLAAQATAHRAKAQSPRHRRLPCGPRTLATRSTFSTSHTSALTLQRALLT